MGFCPSWALFKPFVFVLEPSKMEQLLGGRGEGNLLNVMVKTQMWNLHFTDHSRALFPSCLLILYCI